MSASRLAIPAIGAVSIVGAVTYYRSADSSRKENSTGKQAERARKKRDQEGLGGAGIGGNAMSGGHEGGQIGSGTQRGTGDAERRVETTATSRDQLPSGGIGGGEGAGRSNARAIELIDKKSAAPDLKDPRKDNSKNDPGSTSSSWFSSKRDGNNNSSSADSLSGRAGASNPEHHDANSSEHTRGYPASTSYPSKDSSKDLSTPSVATSGSVSQKLSGVFGQGGPRSQDAEDAKGFHDTKIASNHTETRTKRN